MKKCKITVIKKVWHEELSALYENAVEHACDMQVGQTFSSVEGMKPEGLCESAWESLYPFVFALANGAENLYDGWMKNPRSAMISCNDGFRPVSFLIEAEED